MTVIIPPPLPIYSKRMPYVSKWLTMSRDNVLDKFYGLRGAYSDGVGQERFVFIPGWRDDRVLLVAHADTVWNNLPIKLGYYDGILYSRNRVQEYRTTNRYNVTQSRFGVGIGADDRVGCAINWLLRGLGHSILITAGEEIGCVASKRLNKNPFWKKCLNETHQFAVQFDRRGFKDIVFYDIATKSFAKYVQEQTGYKPEQGSNTDIRELCKDICGVNISTGYYNEHGTEEKLVVPQWENTLATCHKWLSNKDLPKFPLSFDYKEKFSLWDYNHPNGYNHHRDNGPNYNYGGWHGANNHDYRPDRSKTIPLVNENVVDNYLKEHKKLFPNGQKEETEWIATENGLIEVKKNEKDTTKLGTTSLSKDGQVECKFCKALMSQGTWFENQLKCTSCDQEL